MRKNRVFGLLLAALLAFCLCATAFAADLADGVYTAEASLSGGSGKASIESPVQLTAQGGALTARIVWSSPNYTYMEIGGVRYDRLAGEGSSTFEVPVTLDEDIKVSAETLAMSEPHVIDYTLRVDGASVKPANGAKPFLSGPAMIAVAAVIALAVLAIFKIAYGMRKRGQE